MAEKILIGCRLPSGIILHHPANKNLKVEIDGLNKAKIIGTNYVITSVDADFWEAWKKAYSDYQPLKSGALFEARNPTEAEAKAKALRAQKTGLEPIKPESLGVKTDNGKDS